jgi:uncharacterized protein (TIGR02266 family)
MYSTGERGGAAVADEKRQDERVPIGLRVRLRFADMAAFVAGYATNLSRSGVFLDGVAQRPVDSLVRFELLLADGTVALRGEGRVVQSDGQRGGIAVRFTKLDARSKALIDEIITAPETQRRPADKAQARSPAPPPAPSAPAPAPARPTAALAAKPAEPVAKPTTKPAEPVLAPSKPRPETRPPAAVVTAPRPAAEPVRPAGGSVTELDRALAALSDDASNVARVAPRSAVTRRTVLELTDDLDQLSVEVEQVRRESIRPLPPPPVKIGDGRATNGSHAASGGDPAARRSDAGVDESGTSTGDDAAASGPEV